MSVISTRKSIISSQSRHDIINLYYGLKKQFEEAGKPKGVYDMMHHIAALFDASILLDCTCILSTCASTVQYFFPIQRSFNAVKQIIADYVAGKPIVTPKQTRKRKRPVTGIDEFSKEAIARFIYDKAHEGKAVTLKEIMQYVEANPDIFLFQGSNTSLFTIVKEICFVWEKGDKYAYVRQSEAVYIKRQYFLMDYIRNMKSDNPRPVVYLDETWIYVNGNTTHQEME